MPQCCVTKKEYKLECDRSLHSGGGGGGWINMTIFSVTYFLNEPQPNLSLHPFWYEILIN